MCDQRTETERLLAEQRDRALSDRDRAETHLQEARRELGALRFVADKAKAVIEEHDRVQAAGDDAEMDWTGPLIDGPLRRGVEFVFEEYAP